MAGEEGCRICMGSASGSETTLRRWCSVPEGQPAPEGVLAQHIFPSLLKSLAYRLFLLGKGVKVESEADSCPQMGSLVSPILPTAPCPDLFGLYILFQIKFFLFLFFPQKPGLGLSLFHGTEVRDRLQDGGNKSIARYDSKRLPTLGLESSKAGLSPRFGEQE